MCPALLHPKEVIVLTFSGQSLFKYDPLHPKQLRVEVVNMLEFPAVNDFLAGLEGDP